MVNNKLVKSIMFSMAIGFIVYLILLFFSDFKLLKKSIENIDLTYIAYALILALGNYLIRFLRWQYYLKELNLDIPWIQSLSIFMSGLIMSVTPGKLGELLKSLLLRRYNGTPVAASAPVVIFERVTDVIGLLVLMAAGLLQFQFGLGVYVTCVFLIMIFVAVLRTPSLITGLRYRFRYMSPKADKFFVSLMELHENAGVLLKLNSLLIASIFGIAAWFCECYGFYLILKGLGVPVHIYFATFLYAFATLAGALSFLPGGLGVTEASLTGWLVYSGVPGFKASAATIVIRFCTLWFAVLVGLLVILFTGKWEMIKMDVNQHKT